MTIDKLKYNFYVVDNMVVCTTKLGQKKFRATAKCSPEDTFDEEFGRKLAFARLQYKIAHYRYLREYQEYNDTIDKMNEIRNYVERKRMIVDERAHELRTASDTLFNIQF